MTSALDLTEISTWWTKVLDAHAAPPDVAAEARRRLLERYEKPAYCYLRALVKDDDRAEELYREFTYRFIRGDFRGAKRSKGRFRNYLKTSLYRLAAEEWRRMKRQGPLEAWMTPVSRDERIDLDDGLVEAEREAIIGRAWGDLVETSRETGKRYDFALILRRDRPEEKSNGLAEELSTLLGREIKTNGFDKLLCEGRRWLADRVVSLVRETTGGGGRDTVEEELIDLGLHASCRRAIRRADWR